MIYPRLMLARNLLSDDGVIFISCDDNEQANLKNICDELFGEDNFVTTLHIQMSTTQGMKVKAAQDGNIVKNAEYIICYSKNGHKNIAKQPLYDLREKYDEHYSLILHKDGTIGNISELYNYKFPKDCHNKKPYNLAEAYKYSLEFSDIIHSHLADIVRLHKVTGFDLSKELSKGKWRQIEKNGKKYLLTLDSNNNITQLLRLIDSWGNTDGFYCEAGLRKIRGDWWPGFYIDMGNVSKEGKVDFKNGKKPVRLLLQLTKMVTAKDSLILDFFSGSATTAHAVMQLNAEDGGKRKFIMVQLPEECAPDSEAAKAGYKNICEIGKERIRRAGEKIKKDNVGKEAMENLDIGFRVLKCDSSNMKDIYYLPGETSQENLLDMISNIKEDRTDLDLLFGCLLDWGLPLSLPFKTEIFDGHKVHFYEYGKEQDASPSLAACFDANIDEETIKKIARRKPVRAVFRDSSFADSANRINAAELFKRLSPDTMVKII